MEKEDEFYELNEYCTAPNVATCLNGDLTGGFDIRKRQHMLQLPFKTL